MTAPLSPAPALTAEEAARVAVFDAAEAAPESNDDELWAALSDLIPCSEFGDCGEECECVEGELRLAVQRLISAERAHAVDCEGDDCCVALEHRARLVNKAATLTPEALRTRRTALCGEHDPTPEPVAHNHTRLRNDAGPWSPCPVSCPAAGLLR